MESFKIWIMSLCGATAISAVFKLLLSNSSVKKVVNVFFSIFILFYTVIPMQTFLKSDNEIKLNNESVSFDKYFLEGYEAIICNSINNLCVDLNVKVLSLDIDSYIDEEGYLTVKRILLKTDSENPQEVANKIKHDVGFEVILE